MSNASPHEHLGLEAMPLPTLVLDAEQRILALSPTVSAQFPELAAQLGEGLESLFNPRDRRGSRGFHRALSKHSQGVLACEVTLRDLSPVRLHLSQSPTGWVLCLQDLAQERADKAHLQGVRGEQAAILSCMADGLLVMDTQGKLKDANLAAQRCFRFASAHGVELSQEALIGRDAQALFGPNAALIAACIERVSEDPDAKESLALRVQDRSLMLGFNPIFIPKKGYAGACITVRDLSEIEGLHAHLKRVMDCVQQGLFTLDLQGQIQPQFSAVAGEHFPEILAGRAFTEILEQVDPCAAQSFALQWEQLGWGFLPLELCLDQLPSRVDSGGQSIRLEWSAITDAEGELEQVLVVSTDITEILAAKAARALQAESLQAFRAISKDRFGFVSFHRDACQQITQISQGPGSDPTQFGHVLHTLKGNAGMMGFQELMMRCHALEQAFLDADDPFSVDSTPLLDWWSQLNQHIETLLGDSGHGLSLDPEDIQAIKQALRDHEPHAVLLQRVEAWHREPLRRQVQTLAERAKHLAKRLELEQVQIHTQCDGTRVNAERFAPFWSSLTHGVRNALDHGIESAEERERQGKIPGGQIWIRAEKVAQSIVVEIQDDGSGIDWSSLRSRAHELGVETDCKQALTELLLQGGVSTRREVTSVSGRGIGVGAVAAAVHALGGQVEIESEPHQGTLLRCSLPIDAQPALSMAG